MKRIAFVALMLSAFTWLFSFSIYSTQGKEYAYSVQQLRNMPQTSFATQRDKDGVYLSETWQGVPLLPLLTGIQAEDWQNVRLESQDGYLVHLNRYELTQDNFFLALSLQGSQLSEYDIRIIHTPSRESAWVRNLKAVYLEDFQPLPQPKQLFGWENWLQENKTLFSSDQIHAGDLLLHAFGLQAGDLVIADRQNHRVRLNFPSELKQAFFRLGEKGELQLVSGKETTARNSEFSELGDICYLQAGATALIKTDQVAKLSKLARQLGWNWNSGELYQVTAKKKPLNLKKKKLKLPHNCWLELR